MLAQNVVWQTNFVFTTSLIAGGYLRDWCFDSFTPGAEFEQFDRARRSRTRTLLEPNMIIGRGLFGLSEPAC
jgi:hypothetical protein